MAQGDWRFSTFLSCDELLTVCEERFSVVEHLSFLESQIQLLKVNILAFLQATLPTVVLRLEYGNILYLFSDGR